MGLAGHRAGRCPWLYAWHTLQHRDPGHRERKLPHAGQPFVFRCLSSGEQGLHRRAFLLAFAGFPYRTDTQQSRPRWGSQVSLGTSKPCASFRPRRPDLPDMACRQGIQHRGKSTVSGAAPQRGALRLHCDRTRLECDFDWSMSGLQSCPFQYSEGHPHTICHRKAPLYGPR